MKDPVTTAVRLAVLARDRKCFVVRVDPTHVCRDQWGIPHPADDDRFLTLDHVKDAPMMGKRAPSDPLHLVAMCYAANVAVPSRELREAERSYLKACREAMPVYEEGGRVTAATDVTADDPNLGGA